LRGRITTLILVAWSAAMVVYYARTIADNCGGEGDCGAAIGLGLLAAAMIWLLGTGLILLAAAAVTAARRRMRGRSG
jgi:hypothetical protein